MGAADHLLFGLLALQNGLVDQSQLVAAFHAWTRDKTRSLADHLEALGHLDADQRAAVDAMAGLHLRQHGGDPEKSLAAIPAGISTRARLAELGDPQIDGTLPFVASRSSEADHDSTTSFSIGSATSGGQRFRVLRPHSRGGLGAVFVALDGELNREVALKQILDHHADDPTSRHRFLVEAEVTGGLEHPGIVPVYGLGTYADGRPFYAMRFIKGESLKEAIATFHADESLRRDPGRRSLELRQLLRRFLDVCNAIEYAHARGVLHRDIKPGNIIVGKYGETLVVDWGLAKATGKGGLGTDERTLMPSSASGSSDTLPGSAVGTPAYMSPEQARGELEALGPRSDEYSLGATLYCLLTGKPPHEGDDIGQLLRRVQKGEFSSPRQVDPTIDRALEAVCLKAMATRPEDRYGSCKALADDVERWMADESVAAYPEPWTRTLTRWLTRHRTGVTATAAAGLAIMAGLAAVAAVQSWSRAALAAKNTELEAANRQVRRANADLAEANAQIRARFDLAVDAIRTFHTGLSEDFLLQQEQFKDLRDQLLKSAQDFYGKLSALLGKETDPVSRRALQQSNFELADLTGKVGRKEDALTAHRAVLAAREAIAAEPGADPAVRVDVSRSLLAVGKLLESTGQTESALAAYKRAADVVSAPEGGPSGDDAARTAFADARYATGWLLQSIGRGAEALRALEQARDLQAGLAAAAPKLSVRQAALARTHIRVGSLLGETGQRVRAMQSYEAAREILEKLSRENAAVTEFQLDLARSHGIIGLLLSETNRRAEALRSYVAARTILEKLARDYAAVTNFQDYLALSHHDIGWLLHRAGRPSEAMRSYEAARAIRERLAQEHPTDTRLQISLAQSYNNIGVLLRETGQPAEALRSYEAARTIREALARDHPNVTDFQRALAQSHINVGRLLSETGCPTEALQSYEASRMIREQLARDNPAVTGFQSDLAESNVYLGWLLHQTDHPAEALRLYEQARAIYERLAREQPDVTDFQSELASSCIGIGLLQNHEGHPSEAQQSHEAARAIYQRLASSEPGKPTWRRELGKCWNNLGDLDTAAGHPDSAIDRFRQSVALHEVLVRDHPTVTDYRNGLAFSLTGLGRALHRSGRSSEAIEPLRQAVELRAAIPDLSLEARFDLACDYALLASVAAAGPDRSARGGVAGADRAIDALRRAIEAGWRGAAQLQTDRDLEGLRGREDFQYLMMDLAMPPDPFAHR